MTRLVALLFLVTTMAAPAAPKLRPADSRILYVAGNPGELQIYAVKADGTGSETLSSGHGVTRPGKPETRLPTIPSRFLQRLRKDGHVLN